MNLCLGCGRIVDSLLFLLLVYFISSCYDKSYEVPKKGDTKEPEWLSNKVIILPMMLHRKLMKMMIMIQVIVVHKMNDDSVEAFFPDFDIISV